MLRVLIADDHEIVRRGIRQILQEEFSFAEIHEAADADTLVSKALSAKWDIIVTDLAMPGGGGLAALRQIRMQDPIVPVLILSIYPVEQYALRVIKAGATGYLNKDAAPEELVNAIHKVLSGRRYITEDVAQQLSTTSFSKSAIPPHELLSEREFNVFKLIVEGVSVSAIAEQLSLGVTTVSTYRSRILNKMNTRNNAELIQYAMENNLI
jgi:two-component system, NarL family, invasion response regulator UvrY